VGPVMGIVSALLLGFLAGLLAFRQKSRWCPTCGATFACPDSAAHRHVDAGDRTGDADGSLSAFLRDSADGRG
jgi:hypothetical protein